MENKMNILLLLLAIFNLVFAVVSFVPCIMGGVMGMDSPQAQKDPLAITFSILFLTFPIVSLLCGLALPILSYFKQYTIGLILGFLPIIEAAGVILFMFIMDSGK
jgi:hypothetical protein